MTEALSKAKGLKLVLVHQASYLSVGCLHTVVVVGRNRLKGVLDGLVQQSKDEK